MDYINRNVLGHESRSFPCVLCSKRTKPKERRSLIGPSMKDTRKTLYKSFMIIAKENDVICGKCRIKCYKFSIQKHASIHLPTAVVDDNNNVNLKSPKTIQLQLPSLSGPSHSSCCICKRRGHKFITVSNDVRYNTLIDHGIIIPSGSRCCAGHITGVSLTQESILKMEDNKVDSTNLNRTDLKILIQSVRDIALKTKHRRVDFELDSGLRNDDYINLTGLSMDNFDDISSHIKDVRETKTRSMRNCLAIFLTKLRSGLSNKFLSTLFNVSKDGVKRAVHTARKALVRDFTTKYVGFQHIDKAEIIDKHTTKLSQVLFGNHSPNPPAILVLDGTYIYIQKSMKFKFQRRSFSMHKGRPLVKPMMIVSSTGYIVSVIGPYLCDSKNNDAKIIEHIFKTNEENINTWFDEGDVLIVDRGFRDCLEFLHDMGFETEMPAFLPKGQKQHSVEESNNSRLVTKIRWIVESANGRLKQWKYLANIVSNTQIPYIGDYVSIVAALCNKYFPPLVSDSEDDYLLGCKMVHLSKTGNHLRQKVEDEKLDKLRVIWQKLDGTNCIENFPHLDEQYLRNMTLGVYQLKLAKSYTDEHLNSDGQFELFVHSIDVGLLMCKIQSRHTSSKLYKIWVSYDECTITGWYCQCKSGARTVGTCAHISSVVWYLGYARHHNVVFNFSTDWSRYLKDAGDMPDPVEINDSDASDIEEE